MLRSRTTPGFHISNFREEIVPSTVRPFVRSILVACVCASILAFTASSALAAPLDSPEFVASLAKPSSDYQPAPVAKPGVEVADLAEQFVGSPYRWGGASPSGFDCTGFVMYVYSQFGVAMPHNEAGQLASGENVSAEELKPGDVLVFANTYRRGLSHAGIYVGNGQFVHAADERHGVIVSSLSDGYWSSRLAGASRAIV
jgi:cell wall-associated NlpC family hydrolase